MDHCLNSHGWLLITPHRLFIGRIHLYLISQCWLISNVPHLLFIGRIHYFLASHSILLLIFHISCLFVRFTIVLLLIVDYPLPHIGCLLVEYTTFWTALVCYRFCHIDCSLVGYSTVWSDIVDYWLSHISSLLVWYTTEKINKINEYFAIIICGWDVH